MSQLFTLMEAAKVTWRDGAPYSVDFEDIYFSTEDGLKEAEHVFVEGNDLIERFHLLPQDKPSRFVVAEVGFGTGLNFLAIWSLFLMHAPACATLHFISCELKPLCKEDLLRALEKWPVLKPEADDLLAQYPVLIPGFHRFHFDNSRVHLTLMLGDALQSYSEYLVVGDNALEKDFRPFFVDAWCLDGFAPSKNQAMWSEALFTVIAKLSQKGTTLATYSAAGSVRRGLEASGFLVEKKKGFGIKREMLTAQFDKEPSSHDFKRNIIKPKTPWHRPKKVFNADKKAIVVGAGLAGCSIAYALSLRGWQVILMDREETPAQGASSHPHALVYPFLSMYLSKQNKWLQQAFFYAIRQYRTWLKKGVEGAFDGIFSLLSKKESETQSAWMKWLDENPSFGWWEDGETASHRVGAPLLTGGDFYAPCRLDEYASPLLGLVSAIRGYMGG